MQIQSETALTASKNLSDLDPKNLLLEGKLSEGSFGVVYKGKYLNTIVAAKLHKNSLEGTDKEFEVIKY